jgi:hypothetical protein
MDTKRISIPVMPPRMEPVQRDYPISQRKNLLRAFDHEKPMWMPALYDCTQWVFPSVFNDLPQDMTKDGIDWFGTFYKYEAAQCGHTPVPGMFDEIGEWREKVTWPDLASLDWAADIPTFRRNADLALATRLGNGNFERLHMFEGFEQALCDLLTDPEECKAFFDKMGTYKIEIFSRMNEVYHFDYVCHNDDWATARGQFFSNSVFEDTLLDSAVAMADAFHAAGCRYMLHCCGRMEAFLPYIVDDIHADLLEIQSINDIRGILDTYGDRVTPIFYPDPYILYHPDTTPEIAREYARSIVDKFGAHTCRGSGVCIRLIGSDPKVYYAFENEIYEYSRKKYAEM